MKKKILFVIHALDAGGAQKALISLLCSIPETKYDIDLMVLNPVNGLFSHSVPEWVRVISPSDDYYYSQYPILSKRFLGHVTLTRICCRLRKFLKIGWDKDKMSRRQFDWYVNKDMISVFPKRYDVAISFMHATSNYYVIDKIVADKKLLWVHNDYSKMVDKEWFDKIYFSKADYVATISDVCVQSLINSMPELSHKFVSVENIISKQIIDKQKQEKSDDAYFSDGRFKLLSVGRLAYQKGYDIAIDAAKMLVNEGIDFAWYVIGDGNLRRELEEKVKENRLENNFIFLGLKENPYPYLDSADIFVMPSRFEGKSIALDEAKILAKPIVVTKYPSIADAIVNDETGLLVDIDAVSVFEGIKRLYNDKELRNLLRQNLLKVDSSNSMVVLKQLYSYID